MADRRFRLPTALFCTALLLAACSSRPDANGPEVSGDAVVEVTKVTDGDTFHADYMGQDERVRLIGVNTPEVSWYGGKPECFGEEAGIYARGRLDGQSVRLAFDRSLRDRYGRLLAYVYIGSEFINLTLVQLGYARANPVPPDTSMASEFAQAQSAAEEAGRGLWAACPTGGG